MERGGDIGEEGRGGVTEKECRELKFARGKGRREKYMWKKGGGSER